MSRNDVQLASAAMHNLAQVLFSMADYPAAAALTEEELSVAERLGDRDTAAFAMMALGQLDFAHGDLPGGIGRMTAAIEVSRATRSIELLSNTLALTAMELLVVNQVDLAERFANELNALGRNPNAPGRHIVISGMVLARSGEVERGLALMKEGIANFRTIRGYEKLAGALRGVFDEWAGLVFDTGAVERGATLLGSCRASHTRCNEAAPRTSCFPPPAPGDGDRPWTGCLRTSVESGNVFLVRRVARLRN